MKLFDSHCHLQMPQYDADRAEVLARMQGAGMGAIVVGTDYEMSRAGIELAANHDFLWASVGSHPNHAEEFDSAKFEELAKDPKVVAIGECGLDYFRSEKSDEQKEKFVKQIVLAQKLHKALVVHCRDAHEDMFDILASEQGSTLLNKVPVVMHFFTGSAELAQKYLDLGCYLSFPGPITFTDMYDDSIRLCPLEKMLIETDAPFAAPVPHRGKRNEPVYVEHVARKIAGLKGLGLEEVSERAVANAQKVFNIA
ncbi:hypothetical protein A3D70_01145 [Candidatus Adlerbacteria bacterium RIFCSPHIGHO2_02_FULL_54_18]|uniref:Hydrolase TatD n=2 Tax=Candidatus Adleribacteriota TaxID=1752736 RepID=A0A1F4Y538_9BACT|nr:MAG: hypothetical protein A2949_02080 [Candidatus Adlerbacteria bacterium RIFCSPLOWO2_01_FULL_54_21b]OGC89024.1 MAG: hypothetical protein A3D70_01145 [Candidatus Adlerbacteria bacterium RIFCSPHIGHO2_02_FULL_54_18]